MAAPVKDGRVWRHRVMVAGKRSSGTFDTKAAALAWELSLRTTASPLATTQTCADAFKRYELEVSRKKDGYKWESLRLAAFGKSALGKVRMCDVDASHVATWRDDRLSGKNNKRPVQGSTVAREMNVMSNVFTIARKEWKWIDASPTTDTARPKENEPRFRRISEDEIARLCLVLGHAENAPTTKQQAIALAFLWAIETAMRAGEICYLAKKDVVGRVAFLPPEICKNRTGRHVPLSPRAVEIWKLVPDGFGISSASLDAMFRAARKRACIEGLTFHDSRHEAITRLAKKLHVLDLARMVGHKDIRKLMIYYNESADDIAGKL